MYAYLGSLLSFLLPDLPRAKSLSEKIQANLVSHLTSLSFTSHQLLQMVAINLFAMQHAKSHSAAGLMDNTSRNGDDNDKENNNNGVKNHSRSSSKEEASLSKDEQQAYDLVFNLTCK